MNKEGEDMIEVSCSCIKLTSGHCAAALLT